MNQSLLEAAVLAQTVLLFAITLFEEHSSSPLWLRNFNYDLLIFTLLFSIALLILWRSAPAAQLLVRRRMSRLARSKRRLEKQQEALQQLTNSVSIEQCSTQDIFRELTQVAAETLDAARVGIWLLNDTRDQLISGDVYDSETREHTEGISHSIDKFPKYFQTLQKRRVLVVEDVEQDPCFTEFGPEIKKLARSIIDGPVYSKGVLVGVVRIGHRGEPRTWTSDEISFVGSLADFTGLALEIRRRRDVEHELRRKSLAVESSIDGMAILDEQERFTYVNESHARVYGFDNPRELIGQSWQILYDEEERARFKKILMAEFRARGRLRIEAIGRKKDGGKFPQEVALTAIPGGGMICTVRDITARKEAEARVIASQKFLRTVIDSDPNLIFVKDAQGRFTLVNQAVAELYGAPVDQIVGKRDQDFNPHSEEVEHFEVHDKRVIEDLRELVIPEEQVTDTQGNVRILQTTKRPLRVEPSGEIHVLGVATDITKLKQLNNQLLQSQKMEAIGQLAGGIAHDFNNLLTGILGYADLLVSSSTDVDEVRRIGGMVGSAARRAAELTEKLLGFARKGKNHNVPVDMHETIREALGILGRTIERSIVIVERLDAKNPRVLGDPVQMEQIVLNLAINARDAMESRGLRKRMGKLSLVTSEVLLNEEAAGYGVRPGKYLQLSVSDTGCGIPYTDRERIFEPFFTTKEAGRGTGMGLAMVYGIVRNHGGTIQVESNVGEGSTFRVLLPLSESDIVTPLVPEVIRVSEPQAGSGCILVVDDHSVIRDVTAEMLRSLGYDVVSVEDGVEAVDYYRLHTDQIDLIILDLVMPRMGALECLKQLREIDPNARVILSTGYGKNHAVQEVINLGIQGFLQKPYQIHALAHIIAQVLCAKEPPLLRPSESGTLPML